jgi:hypothetical protein
MNWLEKHSTTLQALASLLTVIIAIAALIGVKYQVDASFQVQREQSAKEIYREYLNISISNPDYVSPDYCALKKSNKWPAYTSYVEYTLYTAEQVLDMDPNWSETFKANLEDHQDYICSIEDWSGYSKAVEALATRFRAEHCKEKPPC